MLRNENDHNKNLEEKNAFFQELEKTDNVVIDANSLGLTKEDLHKLVEIIKKNKKVIELNLNYNELGNEAIWAVITIAKYNPKIKTIKCQYNDIDDEGISQLINEVNNTPKLSEMTLDLACNKITDNGLVNIEKLSASSILSVVSGNFIKDYEKIEVLEKKAKEKYKLKRKMEPAFFQEPPKTELPNHNNKKNKTSVEDQSNNIPPQKKSK